MLISVVSSTIGYLYIILNNPSNNNWTNTSDVMFYYIPYSNESIENCSLYLNSVMNQTNENVLVGVENLFSSYLEEGYYLWSIECFTNISYNASYNDSEYNYSIYNSSDQRGLYVDKTPPLVLIINPVDGFNTTSRNISFVLNMSDNIDNNLYCEISVDGNGYDINDSVGLITLNLSDINYGNHTWGSRCWDHAHNTGFGENRSFTIVPECVLFNITTDKEQYYVDEQVDMIINAPVGTNLNISIFKGGETIPIDFFTTVITNPHTTFFRSFGQGGEYVVDASFDYYGYSQKKSISFSVVSSQLSASIVVDDDVVKVGEDINFEAVISGNISSVSYKWDFTSDGSVDATTRVIDHSYDSYGSKTVNLTVDDGFKKVSTTKAIEVRREFKLYFKVLENITDNVVNNATVELDNEENYTNDNGELTLYVLEDEYALEVWKSGYYSYYVELDVDENLSLTIRLNKRNTDIKPPQITLISPVDNGVINTDSVDLRFKATDESSFNCTVFYSEYANWYRSLEINKSVNNNTETVVGLAELVEGKNYWKVECVDVFGNKGVSNGFVFNVELPKAEQQETLETYEGEDYLGILSNNIVNGIDATLNSISGFTPEQKDVAEAIDLRKHLDDAKNELQKVRRDINNLQFLGLSATEEADEREKLREAIEEIEKSTIKGIIVSNSAEYTRYPLDKDVEELSIEFLGAKNLSLSKRKSDEFIQKNKDAQSLITVSTRAWNAQLEYVSGDKDTITLVEKTVYASGDYNNYSVFEFIPKSVVDDLNKVEFITLYSTIKSDPIVKVGLDKNNKSIYYIRGGVSLADIDKTNTLLIYEGFEDYKAAQKITGFTVFGGVGGMSGLVFIVLIFVVLISGYVLYQKELLVVDTSVIKNLKEKVQSRKDVSRIMELVDLAYIKIKNNQLKDAHFAYGEINLIYRELPEGCRKGVYGELEGLSKQLDIHYLHSLIDDAQTNLRYNQVESAIEVYEKVKKVYKNFDKSQKGVVHNKVIRLFDEIKRRKVDQIKK